MARQTDSIDGERYLLLKGMLEDRRREIHEKLRSLREQIPVDAPDVRDAEEQSVDDFVQEVDLALMQMKSETLRRSTRPSCGWRRAPTAAARSGDVEIPPARLRALPFAALCRDCQEEAESNVRAQREAKAFERLAARAGERDPAGPAPATDGGLPERRTQARLRIGGRPRGQPGRDPTELGVLPLRDTLLFPRPSSPSRWPGRAPSPSSTRRSRSASHRRRHPARPGDRRPLGERPLRTGTLTHIHKMFRFRTGRCASWCRGSSASASCRSPSTSRS